MLPSTNCTARAIFSKVLEKSKERIMNIKQGISKFEVEHSVFVIQPALLRRVFSLNKPYRQRIAIVVTVVGLNRSNQQKDKVNNADSRQ